LEPISTAAQGIFCDEGSHPLVFLPSMAQ